MCIRYYQWLSKPHKHFCTLNWHLLSRHILVPTACLSLLVLKMNIFIFRHECTCDSIFCPIFPLYPNLTQRWIIFNLPALTFSFSSPHNPNANTRNSDFAKKHFSLFVGYIFTRNCFSKTQKVPHEMKNSIWSQPTKRVQLSKLGLILRRSVYLKCVL